VGIAKLALRGTVALIAAGAAVVAIAHSVSALPLKQGLADDPPSASGVAYGAYVGPAAKGVAALPAWQAFAGTKATYALDFAAADNWTNIEGPDWALSPWWGSNRQLIYSVPLFPHTATQKAAQSGKSLAKCAAGDDDDHWAQLGKNLMSHHLATTVVRPGWEFDASWYVWAAKGRVDDYVSCFRHLVTAMRGVPGQHFQFLWNPAEGVHEFPAEQAYPGNEYVDYVGVDIYDTSWAKETYPLAATAPADERAQVQAAVWNNLLTGDHGLQFWQAFAQSHGKRMAIPEWGLSQRTDGHGGGDDVSFVQGLLAFVGNPRNDVAFAMYFDNDTAAGDRHKISTAGTVFPQAAAAYKSAMATQTR
jgi:hypothetical protein